MRLVVLPSFDKTSVLEKRTVFAPSLSIGNVGQLAVDVLISSGKMVLAGYLDTDLVVPVSGPNAYGGATPVAPLEVYVSPSSPLAAIQQRSPIVKGKTAVYAAHLLSLLSSARVDALVWLHSHDSGARVEADLDIPTPLRLVHTPLPTDAASADDSDNGGGSHNGAASHNVGGSHNGGAGGASSSSTPSSTASAPSASSTPSASSASSDDVSDGMRLLIEVVERADKVGIPLLERDPEILPTRGIFLPGREPLPHASDAVPSPCGLHGTAKRIHAAAADAGLPLLVVSAFAAEGNNIPDAMHMVDGLRALFNWTTDASPFPPTWTVPPSWELLFGTRLVDTSLFM